jgi:nucleotide-binding universal stress UspA family protein
VNHARHRPSGDAAERRQEPSGGSGWRAKKEDVMNLFHRILVATDFSEASTPAFHEAILMAKENGSELLIANAYQRPNMLEADALAFGVYEEWDRNLRAEIEGRLNALVEEARTAGVAARPLVLPGAPHEAITDAAKENDADLVIMGTHRRKGVSRLFLGSVASRVIATAPCPVMTIHAI